MSRPKILDTTLRDGSYVIDFQFSAEDTSIIVAELSASKIDYIEVGHGLGLGASRQPDMRAAESDEAYLEAAEVAADGAMWGCFLIPGIATMDDLRRAIDYGMKFVRIGTDVTDVERAMPFIEVAKNHELEVFANFMKTYAVNVKEATRRAVQAVGYGADHVCVVDSAGGMLPNELSPYISAIANDVGISTGFHGHNNLGLGIANGLAAVEAGASIVDCSIRGMGRSAGNTVTEIFALALRRSGFECSLDVNRVLELAERVIEPLVASYNQTDSLGVISGYAQFHSSFLGKVLEYAARHHADPRELIVALTKKNLISAPDELLDQLAAELRNTAPGELSDVNVPLLPPRIMGGTDVKEDLALLVQRVTSTARKWKKRSVLNLLGPASSNRTSRVSSVVYEGPQYVSGSAEFSTNSEAKNLILDLSDKIDLLLVDVDSGQDPHHAALLDLVNTQIPRNKVILYSDSDIWCRAVTRAVRNLSRLSSAVDVYLVSDNREVTAIIESLEKFGLQARKYVSGVAPVTESIVVICEPVASGSVKFRDCLVLLAAVDVYNSTEIERIQAENRLVVRLEMHRELHSEVDVQVATSNRIMLASEEISAGDVKVVAGGRIGQRGAVVVDRFPRPTRILGIADGRGFLLPDSELTNEDIESLQVIRQRIARERR